MPLNVAALVDNRPAEGVFRIHRDAFRDPAVHALEMARLFEGGWIFVGHDSQAPDRHDYFTAWMGRQPIVVMRDGDGRLGCFINTCRHKGALLCHAQRGNGKTHTCAYHGWSYDSAGRNTGIKAKRQGAYPAGFDAEDHDMKRVARFDSYRGFLFASLNADVPPLEQHLGEARVFIDLIVDQSPDGIELVPGAVGYTFRGNWKLQLENTIDGYHFTSTHPSYLRLLDRRAQQSARTDIAAAVWQSAGGKQLEEEMGSFGFDQGHCLVWTTTPVERHPLYPHRAELAARVGDVRTKWMMRTRQFNVFPNLQLASNAALQLRVIRPLAVDLTEMTSYCIAPKGEDAVARRQRIRQYEDFFNPSGLATPDDTVTFEDCQQAFQSGEVEWQQGYMRGMTLMRAGADVHADELGITPATSTNGPFDLSDESIYHALYGAWVRRLTA